MKYMIFIVLFSLFGCVQSYDSGDPWSVNNDAPPYPKDTKSDTEVIVNQKTNPATTTPQDTISTVLNSNFDDAVTTSGNVREDIVNYAKTFIGTPYVYASSTPSVGFDCSGFINHVYNHFKIKVPRSSKDFVNVGSTVAVEQLKMGDLILFTETQPGSTTVGHIGIVTKAAGWASEFIHSSSGKAMSVTISALSEPHYRKRFVKVISLLK